MTSVPGPFNGYHEMRHNSAITRQNQLKFWNQKQNRFSGSSLKISGPYANIFGPRPFIIKSSKEAWDRQPLIKKQNFATANCTSSWNFNAKSFT